VDAGGEGVDPSCQAATGCRLWETPKILDEKSDLGGSVNGAKPTSHSSPKKHLIFSRTVNSIFWCIMTHSLKNPTHFKQSCSPVSLSLERALLPAQYCYWGHMPSSLPLGSSRIYSKR